MYDRSKESIRFYKSGCFRKNPLLTRLWNGILQEPVPGKIFANPPRKPLEIAYEFCRKSIQWFGEMSEKMLYDFTHIEKEESFLNFLVGYRIFFCKRFFQIYDYMPLWKIPVKKFWIKSYCMIYFLSNLFTSMNTFRLALSTLITIHLILLNAEYYSVVLIVNKLCIDSSRKKKNNKSYDHIID